LNEAGERHFGVFSLENKELILSLAYLMLFLTDEDASNNDNLTKNMLKKMHAGIEIIIFRAT